MVVSYGFWWGEGHGIKMTWRLTAWETVRRRRSRWLGCPWEAKSLSPGLSLQGVDAGASERVTWAGMGKHLFCSLMTKGVFPIVPLLI